MTTFPLSDGRPGQRCPAPLQDFWAIFEPLTNRFDPVQLWSSLLDTLIGNFQVNATGEDGKPMLNTSLEGSEDHSQRDYDKAVRQLASDPVVKEEMSKMICEMVRTVTEQLTSKKVKFSRLQNDFLINVATCIDSAFKVDKNVSCGPFYDFFGDFHYWLQTHYDRSALTPCAASPEDHILWAKAQLREMSPAQKFPDGKPLSFHNRLTMMQPEAGSGRGTLTMNALKPGCFNFYCEVENELHGKYCVLNMLLHGCQGQISVIDKTDRSRHLRTWDISRWLFQKIPPPGKEHLSFFPHVFDAPAKMSASYLHWNTKQGVQRLNAEEEMQRMSVEMLNRVSRGLGLGIEVSQMGEKDMFMRIRGDQQGPLLAKDAGKAKNIKKALFSNLAARSSQQQPKRAATPPPVAVAPRPMEPAAPIGRRSMAKRRDA